tara:strand:+ start:13784 stop:14758 length:975 start_codon:yes stop_codon:yes gene_type:complete
MFLNGIIKNYDVDKMMGDISIHSGIPKEYYASKDKKFGDWEIPPWELFIFKDRLLGEGSFSRVYLAKWRETFVVAKVLNQEICREKKELVLREFDIMTKLHHPNIVQFLGYIDNPFIIILEYIPKCDLMSNIHSLKRKQKISIMKDILKGLAYIHNRKPHHLIHRDIKPTNILLTNSKVAKITDFGLSKFYSLNRINSYENLSNLDTNQVSDNQASNSQESNNNETTKLINKNIELTDNVGTERYMAPELLKTESYNNKIDIYSCGLLLYELFENRRYIPNTKFQWYWCPKKIREIIIDKMLAYNPEDRLEAQDILKLMTRMNI